MSVEVLEQMPSREIPECLLSDEKIAYLGRLAIRAESLGINDPLTHLYQYLRLGETATIGIKQDIETDIAERLPKTPFINYVDFDFSGDDFLSVKDRVSMQSMTANNLRFMVAEAVNNPRLAIELERAKLESEEVSKLINWFRRASPNSYYVFESLPIGNQAIAVSRIYQKASNDRLAGCFVSLYNPSVSGFNEFREVIAGEPPCSNELEILENGYEYCDAKLKDFDDFINHYVSSYDDMLMGSIGEASRFGIASADFHEKINGIEKVRRQSKLTSIYVDTVRTLAASRGEVTSELMITKNKLGIDLDISEGQLLTTKLAHNFLKDVILGITSAIHLSSDELLEEIETSSGSLDYAAVASFGEQARLNSESYDSNSCPEFNVSGQDIGVSGDSEQNAMQRAYSGWELMKGFGEAKVGVCRVSNCPTRGDIDWLPGRTLVGGCDICVTCHKHFINGKKPEAVYLETV